MTLLLTPSGIPEGFKDGFLSFLSKPPQDILVAYIITAAFGEKGDKSWLYKAKEHQRPEVYKGYARVVQDGVREILQAAKPSAQILPSLI
jgi:hypothetical protein